MVPFGCVFHSPRLRTAGDATRRNRATFTLPSDCRFFCALLWQIIRFQKDGVSSSINSDDPRLFDISLTSELRLMLDNGLTQQAYAQSVRIRVSQALTPFSRGRPTCALYRPRSRPSANFLFLSGWLQMIDAAQSCFLPTEEKAELVTLIKEAYAPHLTAE